MRFFFRRLSLLTPSYAINRINKPALLLPFYHLVSDKPLAHVKHLYPVLSKKRFQKDLDYFLKLYQPISPDEIVKLRNSDDERKPQILLSFDDGFSEVFDIVAPILVAKGIPAIFFITPNCIDNKQLMFRCKVSLLVDTIQSLNKIKYRGIEKYLKEQGVAGTKGIIKMQIENSQIINDLALLLDVDFDDYLKSIKPYLTNDQLQSLYSKGFSIGGHGFNHVYYSSLTKQQQIEDVINCMNWINKMYPQNTKLFAFPFTDVGVDIKTLEQIHNSKVVDYTFGTSGIRKSIIKNHLQRIPMEVKLPSAKKIVEGEILYYLAKQTIGLDKKV